MRDEGSRDDCRESRAGCAVLSESLAEALTKPGVKAMFCKGRDEYDKFVLCYGTITYRMFFYHV